MKIKWYEVYSKINKKRETKDKYNTHALAHNEEKQKEYKDTIEERLRIRHGPPPTWNELKTIVKSTAKETVVTQTSTIVNQEEYREKIEKWSRIQKDIHIQIQNTNNTNKVRKLRGKRNRIIKNIRNELKAMRERIIDGIINEIDNAPDDVKMYKSIQKLRKPKSNKNIVVHDDEGKNIVNEDEQYKAVKDHFHKQLYDENAEEIQQFVGEPRPLNRKITKEEVKKALMRMSNNRATGEDGIPVELLKYGPDVLIENITRILNGIFEEHEETINVGKSILQPIPKPGKPEGPKKNLRPINLLNVIRKVMSIITLNRINSATDEHISNTQSAYRKGRSTTDVVWAHRFICAKTQMYQNIEIEIVGIDMSSAFDTIRRKNLMDELENILGEDEQRMCRLLLSKTTITIKFGNHEPETVSTNVGSPQGDGSSGKFFNIEFENALRLLRAKMNENEPAIEHSYAMRSSLPTEMEYADDSDFPFEDHAKSQRLQLIVKETLGERNLIVNEDKTEVTSIKREKKKEQETWRQTKKLGSLLGDFEDMKRREQLSNNAMSSVKKIWTKARARVNKKVKLYKTLVKSVLTYNSGTWGLTKAETNTLNRIHRKQLRRISPNFWKMKNDDLYQICNEREISRDIAEARWRAFGHMLRLPLDTPCQKAMEWYFEVPPNGKKFRGHNRTTLPIVLHNDIKETNKKHPLEIQQFKSTEDLNYLRRLASDRENWKRLSSLICGVV